MIKISSLNAPITLPEEALHNLIAGELKTSRGNILSYKILKKSLDARKKDSMKYVYSLAAELSDERLIALDKFENYIPQGDSISSLKLPKLSKNEKVAIIGSGPCGLFAALTLAECGLTPVIIERGYDVDRRQQEVDKLNRTLTLNENCNIQFGEGGAGTFSDGKLNTGTKSPYISAVLGELAKHSNHPEITYLSKPHLGTDVLRETVKSIRLHLIERGCTFLFGTKLTDIKIVDGKAKEVFFEGEHSGSIAVDAVFLAIGHSARDTFELLLRKGMAIEQKAFSIGVRIEHLQSKINFAQHGISAPLLPAADYKLATHLQNGRGVYTFCMCPGGEVVLAASEQGGIAVNGMSKHDRGDVNANSALLVSVETADFESSHPLSGVEFQRKYERAAFSLTHSFKAPVSTLGDFENNKITTALGSVTPSISSGYEFCDLRECLPKFAIDGIIEGAKLLSRKLDGFSDSDSILTGVETRSSSPLRILRGENMQSNIEGIYPLGEGCGYAGGITSAAVDGIKGGIAFIKSLQ